MRAITWVDAGELARSLRAIKGFARRDNNRPALTEVQLEITPGNLRLVATDTYRIATVDLVATGKRSVNLYLPRDEIAETVKKFEKYDQIGIVRCPSEYPPVVVLHKDPRRCYLGLSDSLVVNRKYSWSTSGYPEYRHLIPRRASRKWRIQPISLKKWAQCLQAIRPDPEDFPHCAIRIAGEASGDVRLEWQGPKGVGDLGRVVCYQRFFVLNGGTPVPVILNRKYLLEAIRFMGGLPTKIYIHGETSPLELTNGRRSVLVMPILNREWDK